MDVVNQIFSYAKGLNLLEASGLLFGLLCVYYLIKQHIWTWPFGIAYVIVSFFIFWEARLYGDFILHIVFLVLNIYGWIHWTASKTEQRETITIRTLTPIYALTMVGISIVGIFLFARFLIGLPSLIEGMEPSSLPYWDSATSVFSVTGMWLTARKFLDNWYYWLVVDILASFIYYYKGLYFYSALYFIYIGLAIAGYVSWKRKYDLQLSR